MKGQPLDKWGVIKSGNNQAELYLYSLLKKIIILQLL